MPFAFLFSVFTDAFTICFLHFCFAPRSKSAEFSVFILAFFASDFAFDGILSDAACHTLFYLYFRVSFLAFKSSPILSFRSPNQVAATKACGVKSCYRLCVWTLLLREMLMTDYYPMMYAV